MYVDSVDIEQSTAIIIINRNSKAVQGKQRRGAVSKNNKFRTRTLHAVPSILFVSVYQRISLIVFS